MPSPVLAKRSIAKSTSSSSSGSSKSDAEKAFAAFSKAGALHSRDRHKTTTSFGSKSPLTSSSSYKNSDSNYSSSFSSRRSSRSPSRSLSSASSSSSSSSYSSRSPSSSSASHVSSHREAPSFSSRKEPSGDSGSSRGSTAESSLHDAKEDRYHGRQGYYERGKERQSQSPRSGRGRNERGSEKRSSRDDSPVRGREDFGMRGGREATRREETKVAKGSAGTMYETDEWLGDAGARSVVILSKATVQDPISRNRKHHQVPRNVAWAHHTYVYPRELSAESPGGGGTRRRRVGCEEDEEGAIVDSHHGQLSQHRNIIARSLIHDPLGARRQREGRREAGVYTWTAHGIHKGYSKCDEVARDFSMDGQMHHSSRSREYTKALRRMDFENKPQIARYEGRKVDGRGRGGLYDYAPLDPYFDCTPCFDPCEITL